MRLLRSSNLGDRVFVVVNEEHLWERRYVSGSWTWIEHAHLNAELHAGSAGPFYLRPSVLLADPPKNIAALYLQDGRDYLIYRFDPTASSYAGSTAGSAYGPSFERVAAKAWSQLTASASWKLYGITDKGLERFDVGLNGTGSVSPPNHGFWNPALVGDFSAAPAVMSDHDVFAVTSGSLHHTDTAMNYAEHPTHTFFGGGTYLGAISDGFESEVFVYSPKGFLARRFDKGKHKWVWDKHGRPVAKKDLLGVVGDSMKNFNGSLLLCAKTPWGQRVYERHYTSSSGWGWDDHASPGHDVVQIGLGLNNSFFVVCDDDELYERHWTGSAWRWEPHGTP